MKKIVLAVTALAVVAVPMSLMAAGNSYYVKGNVGIGMAMDTDVDNMPDNAGTAKVTYDSGFVATGAIGYDLACPARVEIEYLWQKNDLDRLSYDNQIQNFSDGDLKTQAFMFNGYYDVDTGSPWTPFIGAGLGWAKVDLDTPALPLGDNDDVFAYQFMAGVAYIIDDQWSVDAQYRFFGTA
ncbi:MAG: outer membrane beta-barrel protein, partial [Desulfobulbaceae bacterium]|nr:outer membrane beta-barrel protein [Desulfobulbaceae bacterium]